MIMNAMPTPQPPGDVSQQLLGHFLHHCSPDPSTRTMAAAMYAITHWQIVGKAMTHALPSMLLVNVGGADNDPLDAFADYHATGLGNKIPLEHGQGTFVGGTAKHAKNAMLRALYDRRQLGCLDYGNAAQISECVTCYDDARSVAYGTGRTGRYSRAWDDQFGWLTDSTDDLILRLDLPDDRSAFRKDVMEVSGKLLNPYGLGKTLDWTGKILCVSGSLPPAEWDSELVWAVLRMGLPVFFLPHLGSEPLKVASAMGMFTTSTIISGRQHDKHQQVVAPVHLPSNDWFSHYQKLLRRRLRMLPGAYEFSVLRAVHELGEVCSRIARFAAAPGTPFDETTAVYMDLHSMAVRGIVIGVTSLAYHCLGFDPGCSRGEALKVLRYLRDNGSTTRRALQRKFPGFNAGVRDGLLDRLAAEGLLKLHKNQVTAVALAEYIQALHARPEFTAPELLLSSLLTKGGN